MTLIRRHAVLRRVKDITLSTTLTLALLSGPAILQSCGTNSTDDEQQTETRFKRGVRTYITETGPGNFKITDEEETAPDKAVAIVSYYDGHRDTLSIEAAKRLVETDQSTSTYLRNPQGYHHSSGLANVLLWGSMGYMLGRSRLQNIAMMPGGMAQVFTPILPCINAPHGLAIISGRPG